MCLTLNESWMHGKYTVNSCKVEINTMLTYVSFEADYFENPDGWFCQGDDANDWIEKIHAYWLNNDCTVEDSIAWFVNTYLY